MRTAISIFDVGPSHVSPFIKGRSMWLIGSGVKSLVEFEVKFYTDQDKASKTGTLDLCQKHLN